MSNPLNRQLHDVRVSIEHYENVLSVDKSIKDGEMESDGRPLLSDSDIGKIEEKLVLLRKERDNLLLNDKELF